MTGTSPVFLSVDRMLRLPLVPVVATKISAPIRTGRIWFSNATGVMQGVQ